MIPNDITVFHIQTSKNNENPLLKCGFNCETIKIISNILSTSIL